MNTPPTGLWWIWRPTNSWRPERENGSSATTPRFATVMPPQPELTRVIQRSCSRPTNWTRRCTRQATSRGTARGGCRFRCARSRGSRPLNENIGSSATLRCCRCFFVSGRVRCGGQHPLDVGLHGQQLVVPVRPGVRTVGREVEHSVSAAGGNVVVPELLVGAQCEALQEL